MRPKNKREVASGKTRSCYLFDLRDGYNWCGELIHVIQSGKKNGRCFEEIISSPTVSAKLNLTETDSKKLKVGSPCEINFHTGTDEDPQKWLGFIDQNDKLTNFNIWLHWNLIHHVHLTLLSTNAELIILHGTELRNRHGVIYGLRIAQYYEKESGY